MWTENILRGVFKFLRFKFTRVSVDGAIVAAENTQTIKASFIVLHLELKSNLIYLILDSLVYFARL